EPAKKKPAPNSDRPRKRAAKSEDDAREKATASAAGPNSVVLKKAAAKKAAPKGKTKKSEPAEETEAPVEAKAKGKKKAAAKKPAKKGKKTDEVKDDGEPFVPIKEGEAGSGTGPALVVVESPAKAKTINKYLGKDYIVKASYGHVRDLPEKDLAIEVE